MDLKEIKDLFEGMNKTFEEFKRANDERLESIEKNAGTAELQEKMERMEADLITAQKAQEEFANRTKADAERIADMEAEIEMLARSGGDKRKSKAEIEYEAKFDEWLRACRGDARPSEQLTAELKALEMKVPELKAITGSSAAAGGAAMPTELARRINDQLRAISTFRGLVTVRQVGVRSYSEILNIHGEGSGWVAEEGTRSETSTPSFRVRTPTVGTIYAYPRATEEAMDDVFFDVGSFLVDVTVNEFTDAETTAILSGNGTAKPTGITNTTPATTDDGASPARSAEALEYLPLTSASPLAGWQADPLIDLFYQLKAGYRRNATWCMQSLSVAEVRKLKTTDNQYIWQPGLQAGAPSVLLGRPLVVIEEMAAPRTADGFPVAIGDWQRGYLLTDRVGLRVTVDDNITTPGYVKWYIRRREGGIILDNNAIKLGKYANS